MSERVVTSDLPGDGSSYRPIHQFPSSSFDSEWEAAVVREDLSRKAANL
jgi:hypothetical protein